MSIRRAEPGDTDFLVDLLTHPEVEPYLNRDVLRVLLWVCAGR